jgi:hypothetical protein
MSRKNVDDRGLGHHPRSLAASADRETAAKIRAGRIAAQQDLDAMEQWAASGFQSGGFDPRDDDKNEVWDQDA